MIKPERLLKQSQGLSLEEIFAAFNILANTQEMAKRLDSLRIPLEVNLIRLSSNKNDYEYVVTKIERKTIENNELDTIVNQMIDNGIFHVDVVDSDSHKMSSYTKSRRTPKVEPWYAIQEFIYPLV